MSKGGSLSCGSSRGRFGVRIKGEGGGEWVPCLPGGIVNFLGRKEAEKKPVTSDGHL